MALRSVLVDQARRVYVAGAGVKVNGRTITRDIRGEWFDCRFDPSSTTEATDAGGRHSVTEIGDVMYVPGDAGTNIDASDELEVVSDTYGHYVWQITSNPDISRRRTEAVVAVVTVAMPRDPAEAIGAR